MISTVFRSAARFAVPRTAFTPMASSRIMTSVLINKPLARFNSSNTITVGSVVTAYSDKAPTVKYTEEHEWIAVHEDKVAFMGITKYAADALGDATFVELPTAGDSVEKGDSMGSVESVKSASDIYSPVAAEIIEGNQLLEENASLINSDPMGEAWFAKIKVTAPEELDELLSHEEYLEFLKSH